MDARAMVIDAILEERIESVLPAMMRRTEIDAWILVSREYNEDPILKTFLPSSWFSARRRTILMIFDLGPDAPLETLAVARYAVGKQFKSAWDPESQPDQWRRVRELIDARNPKRIGVNTSETFALADGLTQTDHQALIAALGPHAQKLVSAEHLGVGWLETRSELERELYPEIVALAHRLIKRAFSREAIIPGETTTEALEWWLRNAAAEQNLDLWFHPSISKQSRQQDEATAQAGSTSGLQ
ncbi:MAG: Xaa-Pro aminopeptidase, partial [Betaproteobacteria bacterium]